jgi:hypothetical protein
MVRRVCSAVAGLVLAATCAPATAAGVHAAPAPNSCLTLIVTLCLSGGPSSSATAPAPLPPISLPTAPLTSLLNQVLPPPPPTSTSTRSIAPPPPPTSPVRTSAHSSPGSPQGTGSGSSSGRGSVGRGPTAIAAGATSLATSGLDLEDQVRLGALAILLGAALWLPARRRRETASARRH